MLINREGHLKLTDFGLSKMDVRLRRQPRISDILGTPAKKCKRGTSTENFVTPKHRDGGHSGKGSQVSSFQRHPNRTPGQILSLTSTLAFSVAKKKLASGSVTPLLANRPADKQAPNMGRRLSAAQGIELSHMNTDGSFLLNSPMTPLRSSRRRPPSIAE